MQQRASSTTQDAPVPAPRRFKASLGQSYSSPSEADHSNDGKSQDVGWYQGKIKQVGNVSWGWLAIAEWLACWTQAQ